VSLDITKQVINKLKRANPHIALFFDTHFDLITTASLIPEFRRDSIKFPELSVLRPKKLTSHDKLQYYMKDLELFLREKK